MDSMKKPPLPPGTSREDIGARLRVSRKAVGVSPTELCRELGIRRSTYSMNEVGSNLPNVYDMIRLCARYGLTLDWIYLGDMSGVKSDLASKIMQTLKDSS